MQQFPQQFLKQFLKRRWFLIALTLSPLVRWLRKIGVPAGVAAIVLISSIGLGSGFGLYMLSGPASSLVETLPEVRASAEGKLDYVRDKLRQVQEAEYVQTVIDHHHHNVFLLGQVGAVIE